MTAFPKCRTCLDKGWYWKDGVQMGCEHLEEEPPAPPPADIREWLNPEGGKKVADNG